VLDEPTNDLDVETLELLEELVSNYGGTILLVSHDREFVNNVVSNTLVFENDGKINEYVGGYDDWLRQRPVDAELKVSKPVAEKPEQKKVKAEKKKLSYKDQRDLDELPVKIEKLEAEQERLHAQMADTNFFQQDKNEIVKAQDLLKETEQALEACYQRWEELEV